MPYRTSRIKTGAVTATAIMALTAAIPPYGLTLVNDAQLLRNQAESHLETLRRVVGLLTDAETGQRGYVITGKESFLQPYHGAVSSLPAELKRLDAFYAGESEQTRMQIDGLRANARAKMAELAETVQLRQEGGFDAVQPVVSSAVGKRYMDDVRSAAAEVEVVETARLETLDSDLRSHIRWAAGFSIGSTALTLALLGYLGLMLTRALRSGERLRDQAESNSGELALGMVALKRRNAQIATLGEMSRVLQTDLTLKEGLEITSRFCAKLLAGTSGAVYLFRNSADLLELASSWGDACGAVASMEPSACWGLRRGHMHLSDGAADLRCRHCSGDPTHYNLCLPLMAYGEVLGLLEVRGDAAVDNDAARAEVVAMAQAVGEQVALALSNAKLRQVLRDQSIKDPLTGLYNRRYMEETLGRELLRAKRNGDPLSLIVADLDHFKKINDAHGHPVGDRVLRAAAHLMAGMVRASDLSCRYGGEEFVLILPDCNKDAARTKAQDICNALRALVIVEAGHSVPVTGSFGVATSPMDGDEAEQFLAAADAAMYAAKHSGRNRVVAAGVAFANAAPALAAPAEHGETTVAA